MIDRQPPAPGCGTVRSVVNDNTNRRKMNWPTNALWRSGASGTEDPLDHHRNVVLFVLHDQVGQAVGDTDGDAAMIDGGGAVNAMSASWAPCGPRLTPCTRAAVACPVGEELLV